MRRPSRPGRPSRLLLALAAAVGLLAVPSPAGAAEAPVTTTATFNDPSGDATAQNRVRDHIVDLIGRAPAGSTITAGLYTITDDTVTDALGAAKTRGVDVRVIVDHTSVTMSGGEYDRLAARLGTDRTQGSWVFACPAGRGCIGSRQLPGDADGAINHNKFWLFSSTGGADDVVVQTSANMTGVQRTDLFNNAVTIVDSGLYGIYQAYFADLLHHGSSTSGLSHYYRTPASGTGPYKAYFFPRKEASGTSYDNDASTDTVKLILDNVGCAGGATQIRMAANLFTRDEVASKLVSLKNAGCSVILAHDGAPGSMGAGVESVISGKLTQRVQCHEDRGTGVAKAGLHSKYLLIEGTYDGVTGRKLVWTGSHNYTNPALRANDETLLKIDHATLYGQYKANHQYLMTYCAGS
ncbi:phospholipase D-like domain-containing protein [Streptomyces roseicoloratus]|uniref:phospholipase D n=1 Tax=Streptomyces roseicoloratus TaxID=2508722 RepID=A0ABY9RYB0_9ACTN|nr:phospholipase D-like domain-containing protein [Streptomyces roseicoloratus]WMX46678.1 phospholipase D-like domain-containing protein [Streptomyces roseicoloratus]